MRNSGVRFIDAYFDGRDVEKAIGDLEQRGMYAPIAKRAPELMRRFSDAANAKLNLRTPAWHIHKPQ